MSNGEGAVKAYLDHVRVLCKLGVYIEKDRHVHLFVWVESLLFKAKALDLVEVDADLGRPKDEYEAVADKTALQDCVET
jgi:hypothetical protein